MQSRHLDAASLFAAVDSALDAILTVVRRHADHDFSAYTRATLIRRTIRRMQMGRADTAVDYLERLRHDPGEAKMLFQELLVGVTGFFRDPDVFAYLAAHVLPGLVESERSTPRRVWVAGCSTGEKASTIAMLCDELGDRLPGRRRVQLYARDVDPAGPRPKGLASAWRSCDSWCRCSVGRYVPPVTVPEPAAPSASGCPRRCRMSAD